LGQGIDNTLEWVKSSNGDGNQRTLRQEGERNGPQTDMQTQQSHGGREEERIKEEGSGSKKPEGQSKGSDLRGGMTKVRGS